MLIRNARESGAVTDEELSSSVIKLIKWILILGLVALVFWMFTDPQFCLRNDVVRTWEWLFN
jgi:hypothetical protein